MRPHSFARSRRVNPVATPGADFLGYNGPNFMQQTNFTGFSGGHLTANVDIATPQIIAPLNLLLLALADGDILQLAVDGLIVNNSGDGTAALNLRWKDQLGNSISIQQPNLGDAAITRFNCVIHIGINAGEFTEGQRTEIHNIDGDESIEIRSGGGFEGAAIGTMELELITNKDNQDVALYAWAITRIRQGLP